MRAEEGQRGGGGGKNVHDEWVLVELRGREGAR
jgi:hypothetical protein